MLAQHNHSDIREEKCFLILRSEMIVLVYEPEHFSCCERDLIMESIVLLLPYVVDCCLNGQPTQDDDR